MAYHIDPQGLPAFEEIQGPLPLQALAAAGDGRAVGENVGLKFTFLLPGLVAENVGNPTPHPKPKLVVSK